MRPPDLFGMTSNKNNNPSRCHMLSRLSSLWTRTNRKTVLIGVQDGTGAIHNGDDMFAALRRAWLPTFSVVPSVSPDESMVLDDFVVPFDYSHTSAPNDDTYVRILGTCKR